MAILYVTRHRASEMAERAGRRRWNKRHTAYAHAERRQTEKRREEFLPFWSAVVVVEVPLDEETPRVRSETVLYSTHYNQREANY